MSKKQPLVNELRKNITHVFSHTYSKRELNQTKHYTNVPLDIPTHYLPFIM